MKLAVADDIVTRLQDTAYETDVCWEAAAEIKRLRALVDDYENGINWHTTCTNCAKLMDVNYDQYCQIERLRAAGDALADSVDVALHSYSHEIYNTLPAWREARRG